LCLSWGENIHVQIILESYFGGIVFYSIFFDLVKSK
jgi:hypothetical protein